VIDKNYIALQKLRLYFIKTIYLMIDKNYIALFLFYGIVSMTVKIDRALGWDKPYKKQRKIMGL